VLADAKVGPVRVVLIGTGSEVQIAVAARKTLEARARHPGGLHAVHRVVRRAGAELPGLGHPADGQGAVAVEAGIAMPWYRFVGTDGKIVSIEHFGASADYQTLFREFGFTDEAVTAAAQRSLARVEE